MLFAAAGETFYTNYEDGGAKRNPVSGRADHYRDPTWQDLEPAAAQ